MQAQACNTLNGQHCTNYTYTLASGRTIQPCKRYGTGKRRCRVNPQLPQEDRDAFRLALQPPPSQGIVEAAQRGVGGVIGGVAGALGAVANTVSDTVLGVTDAVGITAPPDAAPAPPPPPPLAPRSRSAAPIADADLLTLSPYQISQITGMSVGQIRQLRASRFGDRPTRTSRSRRRTSKRRVSKRKSRRRTSSRRKSKRRSSRRRSSRRRSSRKQ